MHHIIPRSKGGTDDPSNLVPLCANCHENRHGGSFHLAVSRESRRAHSERMKRQWSDPSSRARMLESFKRRRPPSAETLVKRGIGLKRRWRDPAYRARVIGSRKKNWMNLSAEARAARVRPMLATLTPEKRARNSQLAATPEAKAKKSRAFRVLWANKEWRAVQLLRQEAGRLKMDRKAMGANISASWTPERRAAQAERMKKVRQSRWRRSRLIAATP
jgi:hypothetical protein